MCLLADVFQIFHLLRANYWEEGGPEKTVLFVLPRWSAHQGHGGFFHKKNWETGVCAAATEIRGRGKKNVGGGTSGKKATRGGEKTTAAIFPAFRDRLRRLSFFFPFSSLPPPAMLFPALEKNVQCVIFCAPLSLSAGGRDR